MYGAAATSLDIVGVEHHQASFARLWPTMEKRYSPKKAGQVLRDDRELFDWALLSDDSANPYDHNAVAVWIGGEHVGYLNRDAATRYSPLIRRIAGGGFTLRVESRLWLRERPDGTYHARVLVQLPEPNARLHALCAPQARLIPERLDALGNPIRGPQWGAVWKSEYLTKEETNEFLTDSKLDNLKLVFHRGQLVPSIKEGLVHPRYLDRFGVFEFSLDWRSDNTDAFSVLEPGSPLRLIYQPNELDFTQVGIRDSDGSSLGGLHSEQISNAIASGIEMVAINLRSEFVQGLAVPRSMLSLFFPWAVPSEYPVSVTLPITAPRTMEKDKPIVVVRYEDSGRDGFAYIWPFGSAPEPGMTAYTKSGSEVTVTSLGTGYQGPLEKLARRKPAAVESLVDKSEWVNTTRMSYGGKPIVTVRVEDVQSSEKELAYIWPFQSEPKPGMTARTKAGDMVTVTRLGTQYAGALQRLHRRK